MVAPALHILRAWVTTISVAMREYPALKVYAIQGAHLSWNEHAVHSQGKADGTRSELLFGEIERIEKYRERAI